MLTFCFIYIDIFNVNGFAVMPLYYIKFVKFSKIIHILPNGPLLFGYLLSQAFNGECGMAFKSLLNHSLFNDANVTHSIKLLKFKN